jgi:ornithine cyclodeaminase
VLAGDRYGAYMRNATPEFAVVSGAAVHDVLAGAERDMIDLVERAYLLHRSGQTTNPPSYFLRFPDKPTARIIALPAAVRGDVGVDGLKWISSYPANVERGLPRASAVLLLNDVETGYPYACLEASIISATRTAASAAVALRHLNADNGDPLSVGIIGTGLIARYAFRYIRALDLPIECVGVHDVSAEYATAFAAHIGRQAPGTAVRVASSAEDVITGHDLIVFATTASSPHVAELAWFAHNPLVLHISLRDLDPAIILAADNVVDDVEHVLQADTSVHLTAQRTGDRSFIRATLAEVIGERPPKRTRPVVFSPFGLGVLDLVVGDHVFRKAVAAGRATLINGFFRDLSRHRAIDED